MTKWSIAEKARARALDDAGWTQAVIARELGRAPQSVHNVLSGPSRSPAPKTNRPCLCCNKPFNSTGPQHRLCNACRLAARDASPYAP